MKNSLYALCCAPALMLGCAEQSSVPAKPTSTTVHSEHDGSTSTTVQTESTIQADEVTGKDVLDKAKETLGLAGDFAAQTKDEFVVESQRRLEQADQKLKEWEAKSDGLMADAKARWEVEHEKLLERRAEMQAQLEKLKNSSGDAWVDIKAGMRESWANLKDAFGKAATHFE